VGPGDRVTVLSGRHRLRDGELVGFDGAGKAVVWFPPPINESAKFSVDQLAILTTRRHARPR